ncbi:hypothetical protein FB389_1119 [Rarobacter incanus]|uniref:Uncharacterized protein n=1 Tax=Rarobacter incanus TaxID=153494 RepID=A0A542SQA6_9MICO|nr:hypothetical protein FB389_1119 [Rarobacter incanus]
MDWVKAHGYSAKSGGRRRGAQSLRYSAASATNRPALDARFTYCYPSTRPIATRVRTPAAYLYRSGFSGMLISTRRLSCNDASAASPVMLAM